MSTKKFGLKRHSGSWGAELALGATSGVLIEGDLTMPMGAPEALPNQGIGQAIPREPDAGNYTDLSGGFMSHMRYTGHEELLACFFGDDQVETVVAGAFLRELVWQEDLGGVFMTGAADYEEHGRKSWPGVKVSGVTINAVTGKPTELTVEVVAAQPVLDGSVNTQAVLNALAPLTTILRVLGPHGVLRINLKSGSALAAGDQVKADKATIAPKRPTNPHFYLGSRSTDEPFESGESTFEITITVPKQTTGSLPNTKGFLAGLQAGSIYKMDLVFTGGAIGATGHNYTVGIYLPALLLGGGFKDALTNPFVNECTLAFTASGTDTAPSGMQVADGFVSDIKEPIRMTIKNANSVDYLPAV